MKLFCDNENYKIYNGSMLEMLEVIKPNSIDSIVCDPPYELGFMGKSWDKTGIAFQPNTWQKCFEALKDGGYLLAFGGSRTFHRIAVAIEDAGFEIRDTIMWLYSSGFPKALDIEKQLKKTLINLVNSGIMDVGDNNENRNEWKISNEQKTEHNLRPLWEEYLQKTEFNEEEFRKILQSFMSEQGLQISRNSTCDVWREQPSMEGWSDYEEKQGELQGREIRSMSERIYGDVKERWIYNGTSFSDGETFESDIEKVGSDTPHRPQSKQQRDKEFDTLFIKWRTQKIRSITEKIKEISGWKTALKPAYEPIIVARKPFKTTVAENIMENGVGGINIDECRISFEDTPNPATNPLYRQENKDKYKQIEKGQESNGAVNFTSSKNDISNLGRFPANIIHDGSEEVISGFPNTKSSPETSNANHTFKGNKDAFQYGYKIRIGSGFDDEGSASRYFYTAKASKKDRDEGLGVVELQKVNDGRTTEIDNPFQRGETLRKNIHPTVKPTELMQYLVRLVSPKGATILDPFMGSGSTGKAIMFENRERKANYKFIGIDLEKEYCNIANARIDYALNKYEYDYQQELKQAEEKGQLSLF